MSKPTKKKTPKDINELAASIVRKTIESGTHDSLESPKTTPKKKPQKPD